MQEGASNLLVAEVSVDGLNLLDGPALGVVQVLIFPSAVAWHEAYSASAAASQSSWAFCRKQRFGGISCGTGNIPNFTGCCFFCLGIGESGIRLRLLDNQVVVTEGHGCDGAFLLCGATYVLGVLLDSSVSKVGITVCGWCSPLAVDWCTDAAKRSEKSEAFSRVRSSKWSILTAWTRRDPNTIVWQAGAGPRQHRSSCHRCHSHARWCTEQTCLFGILVFRLPAVHNIIIVCGAWHW